MIPIVLVTGFLGSGKTTLLNRVMARRAARGETSRLALIVNELGEVGIDGSLLPADMARQIELPGGCICCVQSDDLDATLLELIATNPGLEAIVIETTGVAEPLPISWALERAPLSQKVRLAVVVTLVDAGNFQASRPLSSAVEAQVEYADVVVITKSELVEPAALAAVRSAIGALAPRAPVVEADPDQAAAWLEGVLADPPLDRQAAGQVAGPAASPSTHDHAGHDHAGHDHARDAGAGRAHGIDSVWAPIDELLDLEDLIDALEELPASYIRVKGIARVVDGRTGSSEPHFAAFHRVGLRVSTEPLPVRGASAAADPPPTRVVALGPGVTVGPLAACVARAVLSSRPQGRDAERWP
jgi:G3E family GTPase